MKLIASLLAGLGFGVGLTLSGMVNPDKVIGFLDITGHWDPTLAFVMGGALMVTAIGYRFVLKRACPMCDDKFYVSLDNKIDARLVGGAAVFGIGWGLAGFCPGPAVSAVGLHAMPALWVVGAMLVGMMAKRLIVGRH
ncbi:YeeE/YedE family protein [Kordiimonas marina]|uniref:YeeE/YedE family protein n=1 Tax=Kordiimonas marina TaxID=2872312 RepID=UPI001FF38782|nr:YeeE/YedE family protein [Kordiimonas marina]MCJ9429604.1 YeeE/YedE family protein [Kordiimonas marina]